MTRIIATTASTAALIAGLGTAAFAEQHTDMTDSEQYQTGTLSDDAMTNIVRASEITDGVVYTLETYDENEWLETEYYDTIGTEWDQIGNITDVALSADGQMTGIIVETGGFLDIGDNHVLVRLDDVRLVNTGGTESYSYVTRMTEEELQNLPEVGANWW